MQKQLLISNKNMLHMSTYVNKVHGKIKDFNKNKNLAIAAFISSVTQSTPDHPNNH